MAKIDLESRFYNFCTKLNGSLNFQILSLAIIVFASFIIGLSVSSYEIISEKNINLIKFICSIYS